jgi:DNA ligase 1
MKFARLAEFFDLLEATASRNKMVETLAEAFRETEPLEADKVVYLSQGRLLPPFEQLEFGVGEALVRGALTAASDHEEDEVRRRFAEAGDYGTVAEALFPERASKGLAVTEVYQALDGIARASGKGAQAQKRDLTVSLLEQIGPTEAKHVVRVLLGRLRLGIGDPTVMDGLSFARAGTKADRKPLERAYNLCSDLGLVARTYLADGIEGLEGIRVHVGKPVRPALCERVKSPEELIEKLGPCAVEPKIDGFRCQVHKDGDEVRAFSRNLEDMSEMFPEVVEAIREQARGHDLILEGEAAGYDPGTLEFVPFQVTVTRKRKHDIDQLRQELPLKLLAFDLLYLDGEDMTPLPYTERRRRLVALLGKAIDYGAAGAAAAGPIVQPNEVRELSTPEEVDAYFATTVERGQEGIVAKRLESPYQAGARNYNWIKLKRAYRGELRDTVDCVVVGYWRGKGNRAKLGIGTLLTAVYDKERDVFTTVTRLGTGFSEQEWVRLRELLDAVRDDDKPARVDSVLVPDVWCKPQYVIEIQADEITRSPMHTTGLREDKKPEDATSVAEVISLHQKQGQRQVTEG